MLKVLLCLLFVAAAADEAAEQLVEFKKKTTGPIGTLVTNAGAPVEYYDAHNVLNEDLLSNEHYTDSMASLVQERIPERVVHAPGTGALGYFEVTEDITHICKAKLFSEIGKRTPIIARFSMTFESIGVRDTVRDVRGFSIKFYTEEGNLDLIGLNTPVAFVRDPLHASFAIHVGKPSPANHMLDPNALWDFLSIHTEILLLYTYVLSDYGMPASLINMEGFPVHTYQVYNDCGKSSFVRFVFDPEAGVKNMNASQLAALPSGDRNYYTRDLWNRVARGECPSWKLKMQVLSEEDVKNAAFDVFDLTKLLPRDIYPLQTVGTLTFCENPKNHFSQVEQLSFNPGNCVPGILGAPDKSFEARRLLYRDAAQHRLGGNSKKIPVNCPLGGPVLNYNRDGNSPVDNNGNDSPNYYPNSFNGPVPYVDKNRPKLIKIYEEQPDNADQVSDFYEKTLTEDEKCSLVNNLVESICPCANKIKHQTIQAFKGINVDLGTRIAAGLAAHCTTNY